MDHDTEEKVGRVFLTVDDGIATILLDNPNQRNALSSTMCEELIEAARAADADPTVTVIVLRGAGGHFSAGAAIHEVDAVLYAGDLGDGRSGRDLLSEADKALCDVRKPLISAVEGTCMGGAWQIAATADILLAASTAKLAITPAKLGIVYPRRGLERLVRRVGADRAKHILLTGDVVDTATAERWGMVTEVVDEEHLDDRVRALAETLAGRSQYSAVHHKDLIDRYAAGGFNPEEDYEKAWDVGWSGVLSSGDLTEGRTAFGEKRTPEFRWRLA